MKRLPHIPTILLLSTIFLLTVFFIDIVRNNVFYGMLGLLILFLLIYWRTKDRYGKYDLYLIAGILLIFIISKLIFKNVDQSTLTLRAAAITSYFILHLVLLIGPWSRFSNKIIKFYHYRRHLGISVFLLGALHVSIIFPLYFSFSLKAALSSVFVFYGLTALILFFWLAVTSWDYLQKKVKVTSWKILHGSLLALYISIAMYMYTLQKSFNDPTLIYHLIGIGIFILIWIIIAPYSLIKKIMKTKVFGWKQLHVLIWIIYASLILHVFLGALVTAGLWLKVLFWAMVTFVLGSHIVGWQIKITEEKRIFSRIKKIGKSDEKFVGVDYVKNFKEKVGRKTTINGKPIAIFKKGDSFIALSNVCCHQKGPIYKGKLSGDSVECPWHYWIYGVNDGRFLGRENFCLPVYETKVKEGVVFVSRESKKKC